LEIFFTAGFSRTIFKEVLLGENTFGRTEGPAVNADADAIADATAKGRNFMII
jgi:hypothetical protein